MKICTFQKKVQQVNIDLVPRSRFGGSRTKNTPGFFVLEPPKRDLGTRSGEYTKEGENICPPSKIIYMKYLLILLDRMFLTD